MFLAQEDQVGIKEAADAVGVSDRTVRRWVRQGRLEAKGSERQRKVLLADVRAVHAESHSIRAAQARDEVAELRGRCRELRERVQELERTLAVEQRRTGWLEAKLEQAA
jgi:excisionase family DNA binding protein